jgi:ferredoxin-NADP reductase
MIARIAEISALSETIKRIALVAADGGGLPVAAAGAHVMLEIPGPGRVWKNAYSVVSGPAERARYEIIVRRVANSRGGSAWLHDHAAVGQELAIGWPANLFPIARQARRHLLLAGGIGVTPFLAYVPVLRAAGAAFELHHCCKPADAPAFGALLPQGPQVFLHSGRGTLNLAGLLARQRLDTHLYICGPAEFMDAVVAAARRLGWAEAKIHKESFGGATGGAPFRVRLARSNISVEVGAEESLLEALEAAGLNPPCLCRGGACGECELPLLGGEAAHHDHFLSEAKRAENSAIMTCVSRAKTPELVLDF